MGLLTDVLSRIDAMKRRAGGLLSDPAATLAQWSAPDPTDPNMAAVGSVMPGVAPPLVQNSRAIAGGLLGTMAPMKMPAWADELKAVGGAINKDGTVTVYHRTTPQAAAEIARTGRMKGKEDGLFFSSSPTGAASSGYGDAVVKLDIPANKLLLDDIFKDEAHFRLPGNEADVSKYIK